MPKFKLIKRAKNKKGVFVTFSKIDGWAFINEKESFYYANLFSSEEIKETEDQLKRIIKKVINGKWIRDPRLGSYKWIVDLRSYPHLTIKIKPISKPKKETEDAKPEPKPAESGTKPTEDSESDDTTTTTD